MSLFVTPFNTLIRIERTNEYIKAHPQRIISTKTQFIDSKWFEVWCSLQISNKKNFFSSFALFQLHKMSLIGEMIRFSCEFSFVLLLFIYSEEVNSFHLGIDKTKFNWPEWTRKQQFYFIVFLLVGNMLFCNLVSRFAERKIEFR